MFGAAMDTVDVKGREVAEAAGNAIYTMDAGEVARWQEAAQPVIDGWIAEMDDAGHDGQALVDEARALVEQHSN